MKMKRMVTLLMVVAGMLAMALVGTAGAVNISFTAGDVKTWMNDQGAPLHNDDYLWGLWAVRAIPVVTGGTFTIVGGSTSQTGWGVDAPSGYSWNTYGTNCAWFWDASGAEVPGNPPNPLYMIIDQPAARFTSYFGNIVTAVDDSSTFNLSFTLSPGATLTGLRFLVDGTKYNAAVNPATWVEDFFGDYGNGGGLTGNTGSGYLAGSGYVVTPLPGSVLLLGSGLVGLAFLGRRRLLKRS